jgi:hypothetical protein
MPFQKGNKEATKKGKHKKTIEQELAIELTRQRILGELEGILNALIEKCKGGDTQAIREALDRALGRVKQQIELEGSKELPFKIVIEKDGGTNKENQTIPETI